MDTNKDYEHPVLGKISDAEIELISWDRRIQAGIEPKIRKLNKIITSLSYSAEYAENSASLKRIVKRLEKFRDTEL